MLAGGRCLPVQTSSWSVGDIVDGTCPTGPGDPTVVICMDEFGPLNLQPHPGKQWAAGAQGKGDPETRCGVDVGPSMSGLTVSGTSWPASTCSPTGFTVTLRCARAAPSSWRSAATSSRCAPARCALPSCWNFSPYLSRKKDSRVGDCAGANNVKFAYVPSTPAGSNATRPS